MADDEAISTLGIPMRLKPPSMLPYGHSPAYEACERTELVAGCDLRPEVRKEWGERFGLSEDHVYSDYKEMLAKEKPDIVSVCTQPEHRAAIIIYAAQHGARAIYAEKALCASVDEADAIHACLKEHGVILNLGTNRRYDNGYEAARAKIWSGELGSLKTIVMHSTSSLFNGASHCLDVANFLNNDSPVQWLQADLEQEGAGGAVTLTDGSKAPMMDFEHHILRGEPTGHGVY
jgi:predicted dehydrogenase|eukprot:COSAG02_NODE_71_length_42019_cov_36.443893_1_plen_233_part_00